MVAGALEQRRELADRTARLVEFLRELSVARLPRLADVRKTATCLWLSDLRRDVAIDEEAPIGGELLRAQPVELQPPPQMPEILRPWVQEDTWYDSSLTEPELSSEPAITSEEDPPTASFAEAAAALERHKPAWSAWADDDRLRRQRLSTYQELVRINHVLSQQDDEFELVVGTWLLAWSPEEGETTYAHLFSARATTTVNIADGSISVALDDSGRLRFSDKDLLRDQEGFEPAAADAIRRDVRKLESTPLDPALEEIIAVWRNASLRGAERPDASWIAPREMNATPRLVMAPALILRRRDARAIVDYYDRMLEELRAENAVAPLGLAQLLAPIEAEERLAWLEDEGAISGEAIGADPLFPLPTNREQRQITDRLKRDSGVVVQGPPGTGKTHTIDNLLAALLAQGQRVLVTSQKAQALRVLRDKLPLEIQQLCVSMTDLARGGSRELAGSVNALADEFSRWNPEAHADEVARLAADRGLSLRRVARLREDIRALRESETFEHVGVAPGYAGTLASIARAVSAAESALGWMPYPLAEGCAEEPPLTPSEVLELRELFISATPERTARRAQSIPEPDNLPTTSALELLVADEAAANERARKAETELSEILASVSEDSFVRLSDIVNRGRDVLQALHIGPDGEQRWEHRALADGLRGRDSALWQGILAVGDRAALGLEKLESLGLRRVSLPPMSESGPESPEALLQGGRALEAHLAAGGALKRFGKPSAQKQAEPLLKSASVDGLPPASLDALGVLLAALEAEVIARGLAPVWRGGGVAPPPDLDVRMRLSAYRDAYGNLQKAASFLSVCSEIRAELRQQELRLPLASLEEWFAFDDALEAVRTRFAAQRAERQLESLAATLEEASQKAEAPPELTWLAFAVSSRDPARYESALGEIKAAKAAQDAQARCDQLHDRLMDEHPSLCQLLERSANDARWEDRVAQLSSAWAWAKAASFVLRQRTPGREMELEADLADAVARSQEMTAKLAARQAWGHCLRRMSARQSQALRAYQQNMSDYGAGTGRYKDTFARAAREAIIDAREAVPAWIMPLPQVLETIPPDRNSFDVVIVDEASQASIDTLFLLWLAPRAIVVGDDRQCAPSQVAHGELEPIFRKLNDYLPDVERYLRVAFTPKSSLFSLLSARFGSTIRLREHFRCMPEVIGWSSAQFYRDMPLVPLRQFGADRLEPLVTTYVDGGYNEGTSSKLRNPVEAAAIVEQVKRCLADPSYEGLTFGVVVLQGSGQVNLLKDLLMEEVPADVWEKRKLRVGTPPDFQGDERNVVFLSMVIADRKPAVTARDWQRRFNVAASRAEDQMWLFHSVKSDLLSPSDLRRSLLTYMVSPPVSFGAVELAGLNENDRHPAFDSLFEQRVFLRIRARGFHVTPQVEVSGRRIDMVVTGTKGRLAVECDGDAFHSSPEQRSEDFDREQDLKRAGWRFWRIRESEFYFDRDRSLEGLWRALEERGIEPFTVSESRDAASDVSWSPSELADLEGFDGLEGDDPALLDEAAPTRVQRSARSYAKVAAISSERHSARERVDNGPTVADVRAWAARSGLRVGDQGRLSREVISRYNAAHPSRPLG